MTTAKAERTRAALIDAARFMVREHGYASMRIDDVCARAGVSKGAFFHHFDSKAALATAASAVDAADSTHHWEGVAALDQDPVAKLFRFLEERVGWTDDDLSQFGCVQGTLVQQWSTTDPAVRDAAGSRIAHQVDEVEVLVRGALEARGLVGTHDARSLARFVYATVHGRFVVAKSEGTARAGRDCADELIRHFELLLGVGTNAGHGE